MFKIIRYSVINTHAHFYIITIFKLSRGWGIIIEDRNYRGFSYFLLFVKSLFQKAKLITTDTARTEPNNLEINI